MLTPAKVAELRRLYFNFITQYGLQSLLNEIYLYGDTASAYHGLNTEFQKPEFAISPRGWNLLVTSKRMTPNAGASEIYLDVKKHAVNTTIHLYCIPSACEVVHDEGLAIITLDQLKHVYSGNPIRHQKRIDLIQQHLKEQGIPA